MCVGLLIIAASAVFHFDQPEASTCTAGWSWVGMSERFVRESGTAFCAIAVFASMTPQIKGRQNFFNVP
jgi:hypothetical protein